MAQQLLTQQQTYQQIYELTAQALQPQIAEQRELVTELKEGLLTLESCLSLAGKVLRAVKWIENKLLKLEARLENKWLELEALEAIAEGIPINLNMLIEQAEAPEVLEQAIIDMEEDLEHMEEDLEQLRQAVAGFIASQKRTEQQYNKYKSEANNWDQSAQRARQKGDENLAREALQRKQSVATMAKVLQPQIAEQGEIVTTVKEYMRTVESKVSEAKTKKDLDRVRLKLRCN